ncbi:hypothetical protein ACW5CM_02920 [Microbacterium sp. A588]
MFLALGTITGCAQDTGEGTARAVGSDEFSSAQSQVPDLFVADTGVETTSRSESHADWSVNVNDPAALFEFSSAVISGKVIGIERSYVDANAVIVTAYSVQVEKVYKGENIAEVISVTLPGGSVNLGNYILSLDKLGLYEMKLGQKNPELLSDAGNDPNQEKDPRTMDPTFVVTENWGTNPASESTLIELQPDSWVFYLGVAEGDTYYGAAFDHALSYLKDGLVYSLHPEAERSSLPESELIGM